MKIRIVLLFIIFIVLFYTTGLDDNIIKYNADTVAIDEYSDITFVKNFISSIVNMNLTEKEYERLTSSSKTKFNNIESLNKHIIENNKDINLDNLVVNLVSSEERGNEVWYEYLVALRYEYKISQSTDIYVGYNDIFEELFLIVDENSNIKIEIIS